VATLFGTYLDTARSDQSALLGQLDVCWASDLRNSFFDEKRSRRGRRGNGLLILLAAPRAAGLKEDNQTDRYWNSSGTHKSKLQAPLFIEN
jgi:hypothetical protein